MADMENSLQQQGQYNSVEEENNSQKIINPYNNEENIQNEDDMEDEEDEECINCEKCGKMPDNYIQLNCKHSFCLICMAIHFIDNNLKPNLNGTVQVKCQFCSQITNLDSASVDAIILVKNEINEQMNNNQQQFQNQQQQQQANQDSQQFLLQQQLIQQQQQQQLQNDQNQIFGLETPTKNLDINHFQNIKESEQLSSANPSQILNNENITDIKPDNENNSHQNFNQNTFSESFKGDQNYNGIVDNNKNSKESNNNNNFSIHNSEIQSMFQSKQQQQQLQQQQQYSPCQKVFEQNQERQINNRDNNTLQYEQKIQETEDNNNSSQIENDVNSNENNVQKQKQGVDQYIANESYKLELEKQNNLASTTNISNSNMTKNDLIYCQEHPFEQTSLFCFTCENSLALCLKCLSSGEHQNHQILQFQEGFPKLKQKITDLKQSIQKDFEDLQNEQRQYFERFNSFEKQEKNVNEAITESFRQIRKKIDQKEQELVLQCQKLQEERKKNFEYEKNNLQERQSKMQVVVHSIDNLTQKELKSNSMSYKLYIQSRDNFNNFQLENINQNPISTQQQQQLIQSNTLEMIGMKQLQQSIDNLKITNFNSPMQRKNISQHEENNNLNILNNANSNNNTNNNSNTNSNANHNYNKILNNTNINKQQKIMAIQNFIQSGKTSNIINTNNNNNNNTSNNLQNMINNTTEDPSINLTQSNSNKKLLSVSNSQQQLVQNLNQIQEVSQEYQFIKKKPQLSNKLQINLVTNNLENMTKKHLNMPISNSNQNQKQNQNQKWLNLNKNEYNVQYYSRTERNNVKGNDFNRSYLNNSNRGKQQNSILNNSSRNNRLANSKLNDYENNILRTNTTSSSINNDNMKNPISINPYSNFNNNSKSTNNISANNSYDILNTNNNHNDADALSSLRQQKQMFDRQKNLLFWQNKNKRSD